MTARVHRRAGYYIVKDPNTGQWIKAAGIAFPDPITEPAHANAYFDRVDLGQRYRWDGTQWTADNGAPGGSLTVQEVDGTPAVASTDLLIFDQADGFVVTDLGAGDARVDLSNVPGSVLADDGVTDAKLRESAGTSVIGRAAGTVGNPADIVAGSDGHFLRRAAGALAFGTISAGDLPAHATTHQAGGSDAIKIDDLAAPDDNTDLNATTLVHGLLRKLDGNTSNFLRGDGAWAAPAAAPAPDQDARIYGLLAIMGFRSGALL